MERQLSRVPRENGIYCRHTTSKNRYFPYLEELQEELDSSQYLKILDVGASKGSAVKGLGSRLQEEGYSFDFNAVEPSLKHVAKSDAREYVEGSSRAVVKSLPYKDRSFDLVICHRLLPFLTPEDRMEGLDEIERVMKEDGTALLDLMEQEEADTRIVGKEGLDPLYKEVESLISDVESTR